MAFLELKNIGKIYSSSGSVAVGIRGVNLAFDRGEFVAVTGASGSGKSTLLNVISGMDTYEEGELFIDGSPTSHYLQPDWETYREKYISFIFQDYNIIESFTVLQNVELALLHIADKKQRRARAVELLTRVGMGDCLDRRGSKLSGGQKQRAVIARALAKDSPVILADEPTGNLDSKTSEAIIELLREVAGDKLVIVVTHSFEQVEHCATRHIRIFDGAVSFDRPTDIDRAGVKMESATVGVPQNTADGDTETSAPADDTDNVVGAANESVADRDAVAVDKAVGDTSDAGDAFVAGAKTDGARGSTKRKSKKNGERSAARRREIKSTIKDGVTLGTVIFRATPKLTVFLCSLLILGIIAVFVITSFCGDAFKLFEHRYMFEHIDGRTVVTRKDGVIMSESEATGLADRFGAERSFRYDVMMDEFNTITAYVGDGTYHDYENYIYVSCKSVYNESFGKNIVGRYPEEDNEVLLYLPIEYRPVFGKSAVAVETVAMGGMVLKVSGIKYFYDNTKSAKILFTEKGLKIATYYRYLCVRADERAIMVTTGNDQVFTYNSFVPSFDIAPDKMYIADIGTNYGDEAIVNFTSTCAVSDSFMGMVSGYYRFGAVLSHENFATVLPSEDALAAPFARDRVYIGVDIIENIATYELSAKYTQTSLFFADDDAAHAAAKRMSDAGYIAVPSDTTYEPSAFDALSYAVDGVGMLILWVGFILFLAFFLSLCTGRAMDAFKSDMAIMRSMGISVRVIRASMYTRMLLSLVPALFVLLVGSLVIFLTPELNPAFTFLHAWQYVFIVLGMLALTLRVTHYQIRRLFKTSVKKSLKGDAK